MRQRRAAPHPCERTFDERVGDKRVRGRDGVPGRAVVVVPRRPASRECVLAVRVGEVRLREDRGASAVERVVRARSAEET